MRLGGERDHGGPTVIFNGLSSIRLKGVTPSFEDCAHLTRRQVASRPNSPQNKQRVLR